MTETHITENETIQSLSKILDHQVTQIDYDGTLKSDSLAKLSAQIQTLHDIHTLMLSEAKPHIDGRKHNEQKLSLALRAQNQFCRSLMLLDHLSEKGKVQNEMSS